MRSSRARERQRVEMHNVGHRVQSARDEMAAWSMIDTHRKHQLEGIDWTPNCEYCITRRPRG